MVLKTPVSERRQGREVRCECGQLITKVTAGGLERKCKQCKRIVAIPFSAISGWNDLMAGVVS